MLKRLSCSLAALMLSSGLALAQSYKDEPIANPYSWTGLYVGAHAGYAFGDLSISELPSSNLSDGNGFFGGFQVGANKQIGRAVLGIEADVSFAAVKADKGFDFGFATADIDSRLTMFGTVRGRLGHASGPLLLYVTGGLAWGHVKTDADIEVAAPVLAVAAVAPTEFSTDGSAWHVGWTLGAGFEYMLTQDWSIKAEYLYVDLGKERYALDGDFSGNISEKIDFHAVKLGINYRF